MHAGNAPDLRPESLVVAAGRPLAPGAPMNTPPVLTSTYRHDGSENRYARSDVTDTVAALEAAIGALEGGIATVFSSGVAAVAAIAEGRPTGAVAVLPTDGYAGSLALFGEQEALGRMVVRRRTVTDTDGVLAALDGADVMWVETISNPLLAVPDLPALCAGARRHGVLACVDATFSTPLGARPLDLGADVVMHSATKYLAGHSDVLMGVLVTRDEGLAAALRARRTLTGAIPGGLDAYLAVRGLRTLAVRFRQHQANAAELADRLTAHPSVTRVRYPGRPDDPGHARAARDYLGFGAMISFEVAGGADAAEHVCRRVELIAHATSLGGVESMIERRARHPGDAAFGTPANLLRFSVGIEHVEDIWTDLQRALG